MQNQKRRVKEKDMYRKNLTMRDADAFEEENKYSMKTNGCWEWWQRLTTAQTAKASRAGYYG